MTRKKLSMYSWKGVIPRAERKLPEPAINITVTPTDITKNPHVANCRNIADGQSAVSVFSPEKTYQSSSRLMAAIIKNIFTKFTARIKPAIYKMKVNWNVKMLQAGILYIGPVKQISPAGLARLIYYLLIIAVIPMVMAPVSTTIAIMAAMPIVWPCANTNPCPYYNLRLCAIKTSECKGNH